MGVVKGSRRGYEVQCHYAMCVRDLAAESKDGRLHSEAFSKMQCV